MNGRQPLRRYSALAGVASGGLSYSLALFPRQTRLVTTIFGAQAAADFLNAAFVRLRED